MNTTETKPSDKTPKVSQSDTAAAIYIRANARNGLSDLTKHLIAAEKKVEAEMGDYRMKRERFAAAMENDFSSRVTEDEDNIFRLSNRTLGAVRSQIKFVTARTKTDMFGSTPWFSAQPEGKNDATLSEKVYKHLFWKLRLADAQNVMERMIDRAYNLGEAIGRIGWRKKADRFERKLSVAARNEGGKVVPYVTPAGDYLTADSPTVKIPGPDGTEVLVFKDAPSVPFPAVDRGTGKSNGVTWEYFLVDEERVVYEGLELVSIDYQSFRCQMGYNTITESPFRGHVYEVLRSDLYEMLEGIYGAEPDWPEPVATLWLKTKTEPTSAKTDENKKKRRDGIDENNPTIRLLDVECLWSAQGDGRTRWYFATVALDYAECEPVFVDYLANMLPSGHRIHRSLYSCISLDNLPGHWEGRGEWEKYEDFNNLVDQLWNNMLHRDDMASNPISAVDWSKIEEAKEEVEFRPGQKVTLKRDARAEEFMQFIKMPDTNFTTSNNLNFVMNTNMLETGVTSAAKGGVGDLPATNTATGVQSVLASGSTLYQSPANECRQGFEAMLTNAAAVLYSKQDTNETFVFGEGENTEIVEITPQDVQDMNANISFLMTRGKNQEIVERARTAIGVHSQYLNLPESEKGYARSLYVSLLKGLEIPNADDVIRKPIEQDPNAQPPGPNPLESIKVAYADLPKAAKAQLLELMGFKGITPADIEETEDDAEDETKNETETEPKEEAA